MLGSTPQNIRDNKAQGVPAQVGNLWASYELDRLLPGLGLGGGLRYQGESYADALNFNRVPPFWLLDATAFYRRPQYEVQVNVANLTNQAHFAHATFSGAAPGNPRAIYGTVRYRY
jgi:iron complex outermembrane receptor protein